jgi:putative Mg2+ transporter-C (MgtC) family protein
MDFSCDLTTLAKLVLAALLGASIGLEREIHGRPAGFRTHLLVSLGSCLFVLTSIHFYKLFGNFSGMQPVGVDPGRVAAQVVTGIGFLGAGAIIRERYSIRGLTTAACLWIAAAIGIACGVGLFGLSIVVTLMSLLSLLLLKKMEATLPRDTYFYLRLWCDDRPGMAGQIDAALVASGSLPVHISIEKNVAAAELHLTCQLKSSTRDLLQSPVELMAQLPGMKRVTMGLE